MMHTPLQGLYAITDPTLLPGKKLIEAVEQALLGGASIIQYRDKTATEVELIKRANDLARCCKEFQCSFIINDRVDICKRVNASGVHLGQSDNAVLDARNQLGSTAIIGVTCHNSIAFAEKAKQDGASYVAFGRFFNSKSKQQAHPAELSTLEHATRVISLPKVAIGGINLDNGQSVLAHGADMIAVIHALFSAEDITAKAMAFNKLFKH